jgi:hypothetical protein
MSTDFFPPANFSTLQHHNGTQEHHYTLVAALLIVRSPGLPITLIDEIGLKIFSSLLLLLYFN